jgi:hypothetical protein
MDDLNTTIGVNELNDDVLGCIMKFIIRTHTLLTFAAANRRLYRIYQGIMRWLCGQQISRVIKYIDPFRINYKPQYANLDEIIIDLKTFCLGRMYRDYADDQPLYAIYDIYFHKCDICKTTIMRPYTDSEHYFFKLQLSDISNDTIGELQVDINIMCQKCTACLKNTQDVYYINYSLKTTSAPIWQPPKTRVENITLNARLPLKFTYSEIMKI